MPRTIKCFFAEPTDQVAIWLQRHTTISSQHPNAHVCCVTGSNYHLARHRLQDAKALYERDNRPGRHAPVLAERPEVFLHDDPLWPKECICGYVFQDGDAYRICQEPIYRRVDTQEQFPLKDAPLGACFYADWFLVDGSSRYRGPDGHCLCVRIPARVGGHSDWLIDDQLKRTGSPRVGQFDVEGEINVAGWKGTLLNGYLVETA